MVKPASPVPGALIVNAGDFMMRCAFLVVHPSSLLSEVNRMQGRTIRLGARSIGYAPRRMCKRQMG